MAMSVKRLAGLLAPSCRGRTAATAAASQDGDLLSAKPFGQIPSPPRLPLVGHGYLLLQQKNFLYLHKFYQKLRQKYGDIIMVQTPGVGKTVVIFDPKDMKTLLSKDGATPISPGFEPLERVRRTDCPEFFPETAGLLSQGEEWYKFRQAVQQDMMRVSSAMLYIKSIQDIGEELADKISKTKDAAGKLDPMICLQEYALESIGCIFLEARLGTLQGHPDGQELIRHVDILFRNSTPLYLFPFWLARQLPFYTRMLTSFKAMNIMCHKFIKRAISTMDLDTVDKDSGVLAKIVKNCGKDSLIPAIMATDALGAGIDTTGNTGLFLLYHLASNPECQEKLHQELTTVLGPAGDITEAGMAQLKYLKACQKESQRMMPVLFGTGRRTQVDMNLGGYFIPAGTTVLRIGQVTSNDAKHFPDPEKFLPERWLRDGPQRSTADPFVNLPFGHGPRACIGQRFAQLELQVMAAVLVRRFKMEYNGPPVETLTTFVSRPDKPVVIKFIQRKTE